MKYLTLLYVLFFAAALAANAQSGGQGSKLPKIGPAWNAVSKPVKVDQARNLKSLYNDDNLGISALFGQLEKIRQLEQGLVIDPRKLDKLETELVHWERLCKKTEKKRAQLQKSLQKEKANASKLTKENLQLTARINSMQMSLDSINAAYDKALNEMDAMKKENVALRGEVSTLIMRLNDAAKESFRQGIRVYDQDFIDLEKAKPTGSLKKIQFDLDFTVSKYVAIDLKKAKWEVSLSYKNGKSLGKPGQLTITESDNFYHVTSTIKFEGRRHLKKLNRSAIIWLADKNDEYRIKKIFKIK